MYICKFPKCTYSTSDRSRIEYHHIIPRSKGGSNEDWNRIFLCPNCHKLVAIPGETCGQHRPGKGKIEIIGWLRSTGGRILEYKDENNEIQLIEERV